MGLGVIAGPGEWGGGRVDVRRILDRQGFLPQGREKGENDHDDTIMWSGLGWGGWVGLYRLPKSSCWSNQKLFSDRPRRTKKNTQRCSGNNNNNNNKSLGKNVLSFP